MEFQQDLRFSQCKDVVSRQNRDGTIILLKMDNSDKFFKIDGVAAEIWKSITSENSSVTLGEAVSLVAKSHNVSVERVVSDTMPLLEKGLSFQLIQVNS